MAAKASRAYHLLALQAFELGVSPLVPRFGMGGLFSMGLSTFIVAKNLKGTGLLKPNDAELEDLHERILSIAEDIIGFCEREGITYTLGGGSALGAVREGGFIPWDDDMDINMPRRDYDRFLATFPQAFSEKYWVQSPETTPERGLLSARVRLKGTRFVIPWEPSDDAGILIDVFPLENIPDNPAVRLIHGLWCEFLGFMVSCARFRTWREVYKRAARENPELVWPVRVKCLLGKIFSFQSLAQWVRAANDAYARYGDRPSRDMAIPSGRLHYFGEILPRDEMVGERYAMFEGHRWRIPQDVEAYLEHLYGRDYLIPSLEGAREGHPLVELDPGPCGDGR